MGCTGMVGQDELRAGYDAWNRQDLAALLELAHPEVEIIPMVGAAVAAGPWHGHAGVASLLQEAQRTWAEFTVRPDSFVERDDVVVVLVHIELVTTEGAARLSGDIAHVLELRDGKVVRFEAMRDPDDALRRIGER
jgi:ketosteroid isomerase-like protein